MFTPQTKVDGWTETMDPSHKAQDAVEPVSVPARDSNTRGRITAGSDAPISAQIGLPCVLDAKAVSELRQRDDVEWNDDNEITVIRRYRTLSVADVTEDVDLVFAPVAGARGNYVAHLTSTGIPIEDIDAVTRQCPPDFESLTDPLGLDEFLQFLDRTVLADYLDP